MNPYITTYAAAPKLPPHTRKRVMGNNIMVGEFVKSKVGKLEEEIREVFLRRLRKEMTGVVQEVVGKRMYSVSFQDGG